MIFESYDLLKSLRALNLSEKLPRSVAVQKYSENMAKLFDSYKLKKY